MAHLFRKTPMKPYYEDSSVTIYHGDSREIAPSLGGFDLLLSDPPYGIAYESSLENLGAVSYGKIIGDEAEFDPSFLIPLGGVLILWGANNFASKLPRGGWLCWDKRCCESADKMLGSPFELAWVSAQSKFKMCRLQHGGIVTANGWGASRLHPKEKPIGLMSWCIDLFPNASSVLDPFMGSGTTLRAAKDLGRKAVGIEIEERYCEIAARRMQQEVLQFTETPTQTTTQTELI